MQRSSLAIRLLRQVLFCPRIPYLIEVAGIPHVEMAWVRHGIEFHSRTERLMKRRTLERFGLANPELRVSVGLASATLGLHGVADAILVDAKQVFPLEFKARMETLRPATIAQLMAYGLVAAEQFGREFRQGAVIVGTRGNILSVPSTNDNLEIFAKAREKLFEVTRMGRLPDSSATTRQCGQCEFLKYCNDRF